MRTSPPYWPTTVSNSVFPSTTPTATGGVIHAIVRSTGATFRLIQRLTTQIGRLREIDNLHSITVDLVNTARETLVTGTE